MKVVEKEKVSRKVVHKQRDNPCLEKDIREEWICTLPRRKESRVAKVGAEVEVGTREAMGIVGATLTAKHKALH